MVHSTRQLICRVTFAMSLNRPLASLRVIATDSAVTLFARYDTGGFEVFSVALDAIVFDESLDVEDFAKAIKKNKKKKEKKK